MTEYSNENSGALFKNDKKEKPSQPDYKGSLNVAGVDYWLAAWLNTSKGGQKYMSVKVTAKDGQRTSVDVAREDPPQTLAQKAAASAPDKGEFDDDIPFAFANLAPLGGILLALAFSAHGVMA